MNLAPIEASLNAGSIPVIASLGETAGGQILNINADFAANELVQVLQPYKIIFLTGTGGLLDGDGKVIDSINLSTEYDHLKIEQIRDLLENLPLASSVSITRPAELAKELFTHKGSGTLIRRGEKVLCFSTWDGIDLPRMRALIESSFGRGLVDDYFERTVPLRVYVSENYRAAVILTVAEGLQIVVTERVQQRQHDVRERRAIACSDMRTAFDPSAGVACDQKRDPFVIVLIGIAHRRAVDHE